MDITNLAKSLEELIYDVMMWFLFFPYTFARVIIWPAKMIAYVAAELDRESLDDSFNHGLSPPLFLFLAIVVGWIIAPDVSDSLREGQATAVGRAIAESSWNLLLFRLTIYCAFPLAGAAIYEWRTPGGISRGSFRKPFYQQAYLCAPLALIMSLGSVLTGDGAESTVALVALAMMAATFFWYIWTQIIFFRLTLNARWLAAVLWGLLSVFTGILIFAGITFLLL